jgi:hypothetical protein
MSATPKSDSAPRPLGGLTEVKYSLPEMLEELKAERATSSFAMERLDQHEIGKLFKAKTPRRRAKSKP